jgi:5-hydroxyisourate hydrolase
MSAHTTVSTHVLDTALGAPAAGVTVSFARAEGEGVLVELSHGTTNADGRVAGLVPEGTVIEAGTYQLTFAVASYFATTQRRGFYRTIRIEFEVGIEPQHYHVPLLLSPFGYSTYRGS